MRSYIYRSEKKADCYIFMQTRLEDFELPEIVVKVVGDLHFVMELDIHPQTKLALSDANQVLNSFAEQGFYIQMPPSDPHPVDALFDRLFNE